MVAGGGACELRLAAHLKVLADKTPGLEQVGAMALIFCFTFTVTVGFQTTGPIKGSFFLPCPEDFLSNLHR